MAYNIIFIDEEKSEHRNFYSFINSNKEKFEGIAIFPSATMEEMVETIFYHNPDAILTDFSLNDHKRDLTSPYTVEYSGGELAQAILGLRKNFPILIATSFATDAAQKGYDVKRIYEKANFRTSTDSTDSSASKPHQHLSFPDRLFFEIQFYKNDMDICHKRFDLLMDKKINSNNELTIQEENDLLELDKQLEESIDGRNKLPDDFRTTSNTKKLEDLLDKVTALLEKKT